jgi:hypothetical protein
MYYTVICKPANPSNFYYVARSFTSKRRAERFLNCIVSVHPDDYGCDSRMIAHKKRLTELVDIPSGIVVFPNGLMAHLDEDPSFTFWLKCKLCEFEAELE